MLRLEGLYGSPAPQMGQAQLQRTNAPMVNSRGGTSWQQQYMPQANPQASTAPGVQNAIDVMQRMTGARIPGGANDRIQAGSSDYATQKIRPQNQDPNQHQMSSQARDVIDQLTREDGPLARPVANGNDTGNDRIGAAAESGRPIYNPRATNPNRNQVSQRALAMFDDMRKRASMAPPQRMAQDRGVFGGGQQAAQMPGLPNGGRLAALYG